MAINYNKMLEQISESLTANSNFDVTKEDIENKDNKKFLTKGFKKFVSTVEAVLNATVPPEVSSYDSPVWVDATFAHGILGTEKESELTFYFKYAPNHFSIDVPIRQVREWDLIIGFVDDSNMMNLCIENVGKIHGLEFLADLFTEWMAVALDDRKLYLSGYGVSEKPSRKVTIH